jgi:hypothetical protein
MLLKKSLKAHLSVIFLVPVLFSGCVETTDSTGVKAETVYQNYRVTFSEEGLRHSASASFNVGGGLGTSLKLVAPSEVRLNGGGLRHELFLGSSYTLNWIAPFSPTHSFEWIDQDGKRYVNAATIEPVQVSVVPVYLSRSGVISIPVHAPALGAQDRLSIELWQSQAGQSRYYSLSGQLHGRDLVVYLRDARPNPADRPLVGSADLQIVRSRSIPLQQATPEGGQFTTEYRTRVYRVQVID